MLSVGGSLNTANFSANAYFKFKDERDDDWNIDPEEDIRELLAFDGENHKQMMAKLDSLPLEERLEMLYGRDEAKELLAVYDEKFVFPHGFVVRSQIPNNSFTVNSRSKPNIKFSKPKPVAIKPSIKSPMPHDESTDDVDELLGLDVKSNLPDELISPIGSVNSTSPATTSKFAGSKKKKESKSDDLEEWLDDVLNS